jgi:Domain of unknown function (DU1801)
MNAEKQIKTYIAGQPVPKCNDMEELDKFIRNVMPAAKLWFLDGKNEDGKVVSNPNIGYGSYNIRYADGKAKEFYQVGLSANTSGISVYIMGVKDKKFLAEAFGKKIGKASVSGYCIKFKALKDINMKVLEEAIQFGLSSSKT